jgi:hypothetical protein
MDAATDVVTQSRARRRDLIPLTLDDDIMGSAAANGESDKLNSGITPGLQGQDKSCSSKDAMSNAWGPMGGNLRLRLLGS